MSVPEIVMDQESLHRVWPSVGAKVGDMEEVHDELADLLWACASASIPAVE